MTTPPHHTLLPPLFPPHILWEARTRADPILPGVARTCTHTSHPFFVAWTLLHGLEHGQGLHVRYHIILSSSCRELSQGVAYVSASYAASIRDGPWSLPPLPKDRATLEDGWTASTTCQGSKSQRPQTPRTSETQAPGAYREEDVSRERWSLGQLPLRTRHTPGMRDAIRLSARETSNIHLRLCTRGASPETMR